MRRKQAATPAQRNGTTPCSKRSGSCQLRGKVPSSRCRTAADNRARPLPVRISSAAASAARTVSGRSWRGLFRCICGRSSWAFVIRKSRDCGSLQWLAPSTSDHKAPSSRASCDAAPSNFAPMPNRTRPRRRIPSATSSPHGNDWSSGSHASSSCDSSLPVMPRSTSCRAIARRRGSAAGAAP